MENNTNWHAQTRCAARTIIRASDSDAGRHDDADREGVALSGP